MRPVSDPHPPHVSVVICTRNREDKIANAVESVLANDYPDFDLTIIDQSTSSATREVIDAIDEGEPRLHYVHREQAGLSRAYNSGVEATTGEILAFTDDDCITPPTWISTIVAAFEAEPDGDLLYGTVVPYGTTEEDFAHTPVLGIAAPERLSKRDGFRVVGMGANFAARRRLFARVGGFDNVLGGGGPLRSSQDFDMVYRTVKAGGVVLLRPEVAIRHDGHRDPADWPGLLVAYGTGDGGFYTKHVRCRDPYALWLLAKQLGVGAGKWFVKGVAGKKPTERYYVQGVLAGVRGSFRFDVDRAARLYIES
jgi:glycosyltransferase involved in cell wall biosynthesis